MPVIRNPQLIKETAGIYKQAKFDTDVIEFVMKQYFHYGIISMMHGHSFASNVRFSVKLSYVLYTTIQRRFKKMFTYSSKLFGYTFVPVLDNAYARKYGYNFKPAPELLKQIAEFADTDIIYKLVKK